METLGVKTVFTSGIVFEVQRDAQGGLFIALSGAPLQAALDALRIEKFSIPTNPTDMQKLVQLIQVSGSLNRILGAPAP